MSKQDKISIRETISPAAEKWIKVSAILAMIVVAISSAILSFDGLQKVALASQVPPHLAFLFPIAVDTTILMGSLAVLLYELFGVKARFGWFTVLFGTLLSITGNVISVKDAGLIAQVLHGIIPVLLCLSLESLLRILRFNIKRTRTIREHEMDLFDDAPINKLTETPVAKLHEPTVPARIAATTVKEQEPVTTVATLDPAPVVENDEGDTVANAYKLPAFRETPELNPLAAVEIPKTPLAPVFNETETVITAVEPSKPLNETIVTELPKHQESPIEPKPAAVENTPKAVAKDATTEIESAQLARPLQSQKTPMPTHRESVSPVTNNQHSKQSVKKKAQAPSVFDPDLVERCKIIVESLPEDMSKARKVAEIFRVYPNATTADIRETLGELPKTRMDGTISRARAILKEKTE